MEIHDIGQAIAVRKLEMGTEDVIVVIGRPQPFDDEQDFYCPYSIEWGGQKKLSYAAGMDAVQALQLAMKKIGSDLAHLSKSRGTSIAWLSDTPNDTGFPL